MNLQINQKPVYIFFNIFIALVPLALLTGPFVPDLIVSSLSLIFIIYCLRHNKFYIFNNYIFYFFFIFWIYIIINSFFSDNFLISFKSSITFIRIIIFSGLIYYLLEQDKILKKYIFYFFILIFFILIANSLKQFFFSIDFFGNVKPYMRLTDFSGGQKVGSFLLRFAPLVLLTFLYAFKKKNLFFYLLLILPIPIILMAGERVALLQYLLFVGGFVVFSKIQLKKKLIIFFIIFITLLTLLSLNKNLKTRLITQSIAQFTGQNFHYSTGKILPIDKDKKTRLKFFSEAHETHFLTAYKMYVDKKIIGHGIKSFRYKCSDKKYYINNNSCTTHPHNFLVLFLSELGLVGFTFFAIGLAYLYLNLFKIIFFRMSYVENLNYEQILLCSLSLSIIYFPLLPSGNFFNNWLLISIFYIFGFYIYEQKKIKK
tara:strand:+ start:1559 stop:2842 length:1284 start_codon:yes stop_codon:yes gene_type:complete